MTLLIQLPKTTLLLDQPCAGLALPQQLSFESAAATIVRFIAAAQSAVIGVRPVVHVVKTVGKRAEKAARYFFNKTFDSL